MLYYVKDRNRFKQENLLNWHQNSDFWLKSKMRHLQDISNVVKEILEEEIDILKNEKNFRFLDLGCGEGWVYRLLRDLSSSIEYIGIDFNEIFIENNNEAYGDNVSKFLLHDLEKEPPTNLISYADFAVNAFNFFEIADIESAFKNTAKMLNSTGRLLIISIDPIMQILSVSKDFNDFKEGLQDYEKHQINLAYDKDIDVGDIPSGRYYKSFLYSTATYVELATKNGLKLINYREVVKTGNTVPQIYQFIFFEK